VIYQPQMRSGSPQGIRQNVLYLFNYFDEEEIMQFKKKLFERHEEEEREKRNKSTYGETFGAEAANIATLRKKFDQVMGWTAAGKPRYGDLLKSEKELHSNMWDALGKVSVLAAQRKSGKLVMPVSIEEQLKNLGFSDKAIMEAAESVHEATKKSDVALNKDLPAELRAQ
jgi:hypothetical protein